MRTTEVRSNDASKASIKNADMKLEVIVIPVSDVDRAKTFYANLGWRLDADVVAGDARLIQFTPPGSGCSIQFGANITSAAPGSARSLYLVDSDIEATRSELVGGGFDPRSARPARQRSPDPPCHRLPGWRSNSPTKSLSARDLATNLAHASHPQQFHA